MKPVSDGLLSGPPMRLFLFPYAGGGASAFASWKMVLPDWLDAVVMGGSRDHVAPRPPTIHEMAERAVDEIGDHQDRPYALFGHSMGALVAFEVARALQERRSSALLILIVGGHGAPHLPSSGPVIHDLPDAEFDLEVEKLGGTPREVLENGDLMDIVRPGLRIDFKASHSYEFTPDRPLEIPIDVLGGLRDAEAPEADLAAWSEHTNRECRVRMFSGGHFFIHEQKTLVVRYLSNLMRSISPT